MLNFIISHKEPLYQAAFCFHSGGVMAVITLFLRENKLPSEQFYLIGCVLNLQQ